MTTNAHNQRSTTRAIATSGISLLTLVTLMACLTTRHAQAPHRDASATRIASSILISNASIVIVSSIEEASPHTDTRPLDPETRERSIHSLREHSFQFNPSLLAMPPPAC
ncbi:MAG: hypothetical protein ACYTF7_02235 [Planctomycetota bacterium]